MNTVRTDRDKNDHIVGLSYALEFILTFLLYLILLPMAQTVSDLYHRGKQPCLR